jgi:hypothetical protein
MNKANELLALASEVGDCLECHLSDVTQGYCKIKYKGAQFIAHRFVYSALVCDPGDSLVLHKCDNRRCINPEHLYHGTQKNNVDDMIARGRHVPGKGAGKGATGLFDSQRNEILRLHEEGWTQRAIAEQVGWSQRTVWNVIHTKVVS